MARIPYADANQFDEKTARLIGQLAPLNIFRMMANAPGLLRPFVMKLQQFMAELA